MGSSHDLSNDEGHPEMSEAELAQVRASACNPLNSSGRVLCSGSPPPVYLQLEQSFGHEAIFFCIVIPWMDGNSCIPEYHRAGMSDACASRRDSPMLHMLTFLED
jgi:hypothetical protein